MGTKKYKILLSISEYEYLISVCTNVAMKRYLQKRLRAIDHGDIQADLEVTDSLESRIGMKPSERKTLHEKEEEERFLNDQMSPEEEIIFKKKHGINV